MNHIVDTFPLTKFEGGLNLVHEVDDDAVIWPESIQRPQHSRTKYYRRGKQKAFIVTLHSQ